MSLAESSAASVQPGSKWVVHKSHPHILTCWQGSAASKRRLFRCSACEYWNDRFCHTKMHYKRIHVQQGNAVPKRRKYAAAWAEGVPLIARRTPAHKAAATAERSKHERPPSRETFAELKRSDRKRTPSAKAPPACDPTPPKKRRGGHTQRAAAGGEAAQVRLPRTRVFTFGSFSIERSISFEDQGWGKYDAAGDGAAEDQGGGFLRGDAGDCAAEDQSGGLLREGAGEASAGEDLDFLMPTYSLWKWEQFDTPELYASQLTHWLCTHNIAVKRPYDAVHQNSQRQLDLSRMQLLKSRAENFQKTWPFEDSMQQARAYYNLAVCYGKQSDLVSATRFDEQCLLAALHAIPSSVGTPSARVRFQIPEKSPAS